MPDKKEPIWRPSNDSEVATKTPSTPKPSAPTPKK